jgi:hypothetical protein
MPRNQPISRTSLRKSALPCRSNGSITGAHRHTTRSWQPAAGSWYQSVSKRAWREGDCCACIFADRTGWSRKVLASRSRGYSTTQRGHTHSSARPGRTWWWSRQIRLSRSPRRRVCCSLKNYQEPVISCRRCPPDACNWQLRSGCETACSRNCAALWLAYRRLLASPSKRPVPTDTVRTRLIDACSQFAQAVRRGPCAENAAPSI